MQQSMESAKLPATRPLLPYVLSCLTFYCTSHASFLTCYHALLASCLTWFIPYVLLYLKCLVPCVSRAARATCRACSFTLHSSFTSAVSGLTHSYASNVW